jgi:hypothetical protein
VTAGQGALAVKPPPESPVYSAPCQVHDVNTAHLSPKVQADTFCSFTCTATVSSVAVNSMAGWVLGLGDRHSTNILLDLHTAACVHIDLGVAFEQVSAGASFDAHLFPLRLSASHQPLL